MTYRDVTHIALYVTDLRAAEGFYRALFGMEEAFRAGPDGQVPLGAAWDDIEAAGVRLGISMLYRGAFRLALEATQEEPPQGRLAHVGLQVDEGEMERLRREAPAAGCRVPAQRDDLLVLVDPYGLQWEMTTRPFDDPRRMGDGPRLGRWADVTRRRG